MGSFGVPDFQLVMTEGVTLTLTRNSVISVNTVNITTIGSLNKHLRTIRKNLEQ